VQRYAFVARTKQGKINKGTLEAPNPEEAVSILQDRSLIVISLKESQEGPVSIGISQGSHGKVRTADLAIFARSLAAMLEAGLPLLRTLEIVGDQTRSDRLRTIIADIIHDIRGGSTFRDAVAKHPTIFSNFWIALIETGEASGQLTQGLKQILVHLEKSDSVRRKVVSALLYPMVLLIGAIIAVLIFSLKIIPTFSSLYYSMGSNLPFLTRMVMSFSEALSRYFLFIIGGIGLLWFLVKSYTQTPIGRLQFDKLQLRLPLFGPLFQMVAAQRFSANLGTLLKAGVPIVHALEISSSTCENKVVASLLEHMKTGVQEGRSLADPLSKTDVFPSMVGQMISVGEQTGRLPEMLAEIALYYEEQATTLVERLTTLLEPLMLVGIAVVIGTLVIAMYLPIFEISQNLKG